VSSRTARATQRNPVSKTKKKKEEEKKTFLVYCAFSFEFYFFLSFKGFVVFLRECFVSGFVLCFYSILMCFRVWGFYLGFSVFLFTSQVVLVVVVVLHYFFKFLGFNFGA
jgi:hypothetical protein